MTGRWTCENCSNKFDRCKSGGRSIRFCGQSCYHAWRKKNGITTGQFVGGQVAWNKGIKGTHFSPKTEFRPGQRPVNWRPTGSENIRADHNGALRTFVKTAEPNIWELKAVIVWERHNGCLVPDGYVVHHKDHNSLNDSPSNLQALTRSEHIEEHRHDLNAARGLAA